MKICLSCKIKFTPTGNNQLYHSKECARIHSIEIGYFKKVASRHKENFKSIFKVRSIKRECLKCHRLFRSEGVYNRVCQNCKNGFEFDKGTIYYAQS